MTVSHEHPILWEPDDPHEAMADTIASLRVDGIELDEFGLSILQRIADGEIDTDEAIAILNRHHRK
jgi:hypothetical protein